MTIMHIKYTLYVLITLILLGFYNCSYSEEFYEVKKENYRIELPSYVKSLSNKLSETADFQYGNQFRNFYVVIEEKDKSTTSIEAYAKNSLETILSTPYVKEPDTLAFEDVQNFNGLNGSHIALTAIVGDSVINEKILYHLYHLESPTQYYHVAIWTWAQWQEKYKEDTEKIIASFREI